MQYPCCVQDADLLYEAKYGQRGEDGKMSKEQYQALRRKIGGTAKDYWKDWVEEERVENSEFWRCPHQSRGITMCFLADVYV